MSQLPNLESTSVAMRLAVKAWIYKLQIAITLATIVFLYKLYNKLDELGIIAKFNQAISDLILNTFYKANLIVDRCITREYIGVFSKMWKCIINT